MRSRLMLIVLCLTMVALIAPTAAHAGFFDFFHRKHKPATGKELLQQQRAARQAKQKKPVVPKRYLFQQ